MFLTVIWILLFIGHSDGAGTPGECRQLERAMSWGDVHAACVDLRR